MKLVMNCLDEDQTVIAGGNHFAFKPRQIKGFYQENLAKFIYTDKKEYGFVEIPAELEDLEKRNSPEGIAIIDGKRKEGIDAYCARLRALVYNAQVSVKKDLDMANIKADPRSFASSGDLKNLEQLVKYQVNHEDETQNRVDKIKELEKKLQKV